ncbi:MAG: heavy metal transport/detoxification protein [Bacteroidetes bacterium]|nr:heavy metal transport/detoxification protein [Bacteroidota bacterium]
MTHTYNVSGMTCSGCEAKVKSGLLKLPDVLSAEVSKDTGTATITMEKHISLPALQEALGGPGSKYQVTAAKHNETLEQTKSWLETYKPILLIFSYITIATILIQLGNQRFSGMQWMQHFMAGFFLVFSFFKMLNLQGFAESYAMYDVVAMKFRQWGYVYAVIELALGLAYLANFEPYLTNIATLAVMSISIIGVLRSVFNKQKIQCACLGAVFNLPMSTVTIIEDLLMILMSATMLILM